MGMFEIVPAIRLFSGSFPNPLSSLFSFRYFSGPGFLCSDQGAFGKERKWNNDEKCFFSFGNHDRRSLSFLKPVARCNCLSHSRLLRTGVFTTDSFVLPDLAWNIVWWLATLTNHEGINHSWPWFLPAGELFLKTWNRRLDAYFRLPCQTWTSMNSIHDYSFVSIQGSLHKKLCKSDHSPKIPCHFEWRLCEAFVMILDSSEEEEDQEEENEELDKFPCFCILEHRFNLAMYFNVLRVYPCISLL